MANYQGKKVVIIGLGLTGLSCVDFFLSHKVIPQVIDTRTSPPGIDKLPSNVPCHTGSYQAQWLAEADLIVVSPGIALSTPQLKTAADHGIEIVGDIELFCREAQAPIIAITGSNGKSTVTCLVGEMAKAAGLSVGIGGNIGIPALSLLKTNHQLYVLELSSFQLETTASLRAAAATVLNISADHMDRYPEGLQQYRNAKLKIYQNAKYCIVNAQDPLTLPLNSVANPLIRFGIDQGDYAFDSQNRMLNAQHKQVLAVDQMRLTGQHNYANALAALALADAVNIPREASIDVLKYYPGLDHRFQLVHLKQGVRWINDSKATNVGSTEAALQGLKIDGTLFLLLGGDGKSADFSALKPYIEADNIQLYCFGRDGERLAAMRPEIAQQTETMEQSMKLLAKRLKSGDMVLLSPACASLDQFKNFEQRGDEFARLAKELGS